MNFLLSPLGNVTLTVPANSSLVVYTQGQADVSQLVGPPAFPAVKKTLGTVVNALTTFGPFTSATRIVIDAGAFLVKYAYGTSPVINELLAYQVQGAPTAVNAGGGALTAAAILGGIISSTTPSNLSNTLPTGTLLDAASNFAINDSFDWIVYNTGANTFTVAAGTDHTIDGNAVVAATSSGQFRTRKTAANTWVTTRSAN